MTFRFKDYHQDRKIRVRKLPVLTFIDRLVLTPAGGRVSTSPSLWVILEHQTHQAPEEGSSTFSPEEKTPFQAPDVGAEAPGSGGQEASFLPAMWPSDGALVPFIRTTPYDRATAWDRTTDKGPSQSLADSITGLSCHDLTITARYRNSETVKELASAMLGYDKAVLTNGVEKRRHSGGDHVMSKTYRSDAASERSMRLHPISMMRASWTSGHCANLTGFA